jgi:TatD DNase family protein
MLIETDSPYLAPMPYRGKENQPSYVVEVAEFLAALRQEPLDKFAQQTTQNFYDLFNTIEK